MKILYHYYIHYIYCNHIYFLLLSLNPLIIFYDPVKKVIANVHSGWRGTFQKIAEKTVLKMIENYNCNPEDIECFIWPSIRKCHFEVETDVKELCEKTFAYTN